MKECEFIEAMEMVHVRLFDTKSRAKVVDIFLREAGPSLQSLKPTLFRSSIVPNDGSICFWRNDSVRDGSKSPACVRCAEALRSIGLVDHTVWQLSRTGKSGHGHFNISRGGPSYDLEQVGSVRL